jgi:Raf kinase inhibitor-like YbhB/YbcL family protein
MDRVLSLSFAIALVASSTVMAAQGAPGGGGRGGAMALTTTGWADGAQIPIKYTQAGEQVSPDLKWTNAPAGTQSFVVNMLDPDVAQQRGTETQVHWVVWNIPGAEMADGSRQISASGPQYRGPGAPATGPMHHYTFEVYALDIKLDVAASTATPVNAAALETRAAVFMAMQGHVLGKAVYVGLFRRP